jgi:hypothetical protein
VHVYCCLYPRQQIHLLPQPPALLLLLLLCQELWAD